MKRVINIIGILGLLFLMPLYCYAEDAKPVAAFAFTKTSYQQSEPIEVIDNSYAQNGNKITKVEWTAVIKGKKQTSGSYKALLKSAPLGEYKVFLRVKDNNGVWSEATWQKVTITSDKPMVLTGFTSGKSSYGIGEKLNLTYTYDNPNDLEVTGQRWRYRNVTTNGNNIAGKPRYFKKAGTYEITLEIQDEWGNWSNRLSCQVSVTNEVIERNGYYLFEKGKAGDLISGYVDKDYNQFEPAHIMESVDIPGTLLMSNSPETIKSSGILYQDTVSGRGRLILHHVNGTNVSKKLLVTVTNPGKQDVTLTISNNAIKGPGKHIMQVGQSAVMQYMNSTDTKNYKIAPGQSVCIYSSATYGSWDRNEVVTGTVDFNSNDKLTFIIAALDEKSAMDNIAKLSVLARDTHDRGTFKVIERQYTLDLNNIKELEKLVIGREKEEWLQGVDATTGKPAQNRGNYGVPIKIKVINNEDMGVVINARGGAYMGALKWYGKKVFKVPGEQVLKSQEVAALVGCIRAGEDNEIVYMLPNGSSAPILFGFIPKSTWK